MKPTMTILDYLWSLRKTWFRCQDEVSCGCSFEARAYAHIDRAVEMNDWCQIQVVNGVTDIKMIRRTADDWDDLCGPSAEHEALQHMLDMHMNEVSKILSLQATEERLRSE